MKVSRIILFLPILLCAGCLTNRFQQAQSPVTIQIDAKAPGFHVPADFSGLSFEMQAVLPDANGKHIFSPENKPLVNLFRTLGVKILRVGGNTADRPGIAVPDRADADSLFAFAKAADVKVIYTLRLRNGNIKTDTEIAKYIEQHYQSQLACFAIGNEPDFYFKTYPAYHTGWEEFATAIRAEAPDAKFCGPCTGGKPDWTRDFAKDFEKSKFIAFVAQHDYPCGNGLRATNAVAGRNKMLSPKLLSGYQSFWHSFAPAVLSDGLPYRLEEANSFYNGGAENVSDTYAASLWGLDFLHWWAAHDASGVNFHTGDKVAAGSENRPCWYASFWTTNDGYDVHPMGYAIKAFNLGGHGRILPVTMANTDGLNLTAYAVRNAENDLFVTVINKEHGADRRAARVTIAPDEKFSHVETISLTAPHDNIATKTGVTLGGASITDDGSWDGKWTSLKTDQSDSCALTVPAATAVIVKLSPG
jgi:Glycosyl hydrolase family 79 C-terminal beta domain